MVYVVVWVRKGEGQCGEAISSEETFPDDILIIQMELTFIESACCGIAAWCMWLFG